MVKRIYDLAKVVPRHVFLELSNCYASIKGLIGSLINKVTITSSAIALVSMIESSSDRASVLYRLGYKCHECRGYKWQWPQKRFYLHIFIKKGPWKWDGIFISLIKSGWVLTMHGRFWLLLYYLWMLYVRYLINLRNLRKNWFRNK